MKIRNVISRVYELTWIGPIAHGGEGLQKHPIDPQAPGDNAIEKILKRGGLYMIIGDHPTHGSRTLLYIGQTKDFDGRFWSHRNWLKEEWQVEVYLCELVDPKIRDDAERLLIYAHSPAYNSRNIDSLKLTEPIRIWNVGRYWRLFPEISSEHVWYKEIGTSIRN